MSEKVAKKTKKNVLDYGMEWFDYHLTVGIYISIIISALLFIFVFLGQFYRPGIYEVFPKVRLLDKIMWIYYLAYTVVIFITRKAFFAEDKKSFGLFLLLFLIRAVFHAFVVFYLSVITKGIIGTANSIFYTYIFYFAVLTTVVNVINIIYFIVRRHIFDYNKN